MPADHLPVWVVNGGEDRPHPRRALHQGGGSRGSIRATRQNRLERLAKNLDRQRVADAPVSTPTTTAGTSTQAGSMRGE